MYPFATNPAHMTDALLIGSNFLIIAATIALAYYTAKVANETAREVRKDDARIIRLLVKRNSNARHARRQKRQEAENIRRLG